MGFGGRRAGRAPWLPAGVWLLVGRRRCGELLRWAITSRVRVVRAAVVEGEVGGGTMTFDVRAVAGMAGGAGVRFPGRTQSRASVWAAWCFLALLCFRFRVKGDIAIHGTKPQLTEHRSKIMLFQFTWTRLCL